MPADLRSYTDGGAHYATQIGAEATPQEFIAALVACTREMCRVLKPSGSIFVNLGDRYATGYSSLRAAGRAGLNDDDLSRGRSGQNRSGVPEKSLMLLPERYRIACTDELGLITRAVIIWAKPNGLPESVTDRVRRSHEDWVHLTKAPRYFAAVDEIREPHERPDLIGKPRAGRAYLNRQNEGGGNAGNSASSNPLGKLPDSVWEIASQPLRVPAELGVDHFAAFPMEWPRRLILGWSPAEVCTACAEGRRPEVHAQRMHGKRPIAGAMYGKAGRFSTATGRSHIERTDRTITGYACACSDATGPATRGVVLDPFGGTGTTALVATMLGRRGISVDRSADYCRIARWRSADPKERARAAGLDPDAVAAIRRELPGQASLFEEHDAC